MPQTHCNRHTRREPFTCELLRAPERLQLSGWRHYALDEVLYEHRTMLFGGPIVWFLTAIASAVGNRRRRQEAERAAAPQWRPLGPLAVEVHADRLVVHPTGDLEPGVVWLAGVVDVRTDPRLGIVDLYFEQDAPYRFQGPDAQRLIDAFADRRSAQGVHTALIDSGVSEQRA